MCIAGGNIAQFERSLSGEWDRAEGPRTSLRHVRAHDHLFFEGDQRTHLFLVESGWIKLYRTLVDGQRQVVGFANAGSVLGFESEEDHLNGCEAITPVSVRAIPVGRLSEMCARNGKFAEYLLNQIGRQLGAAQAQLAAVGTQSAEQKLASFLLSICRLCGATRGGEFDLPMRRGEMAEFLGLRLETVSRKMSEFQRRGWIRMSSLYHCCIVRRDILAELAQGGSAEDHPMMRSA